MVSVADDHRDNTDNSDCVTVPFLDLSRGPPYCDPLASFKYTDMDIVSPASTVTTNPANVPSWLLNGEMFKVNEVNSGVVGLGYVVKRVEVKLMFRVTTNSTPAFGHRNVFFRVVLVLDSFAQTSSSIPSLPWTGLLTPFPTGWDVASTSGGLGIYGMINMYPFRPEYATQRLVLLDKYAQAWNLPTDTPTNFVPHVASPMSFIMNCEVPVSFRDDDSEIYGVSNPVFRLYIAPITPANTMDIPLQYSYVGYSRIYYADY